MSTSKEVLISVAQRFVDAYRAGEKSVEVRRRRLNVPPQTRVWIYTKKPTGRVELVGRIEAVIGGTPLQLWKEYGERMGLTRAEFFQYVEGCELAYVIPIEDLKELESQPTLGRLRRGERGFHPPQFARFVEKYKPLHRILTEAESGTAD